MKAFAPLFSVGYTLSSRGHMHHMLTVACAFLVFVGLQPLYASADCYQEVQVPFCMTE